MKFRTTMNETISSVTTRLSKRTVKQIELSGSAGAQQPKVTVTFIVEIYNFQYGRSPASISVVLEDGSVEFLRHTIEQEVTDIISLYFQEIAKGSNMRGLCPNWKPWSSLTDSVDAKRLGVLTRNNTNI